MGNMTACIGLGYLYQINKNKEQCDILQWNREHENANW